MADALQNMPDIILRASVCNTCNFACGYCPKNDWASGGMENYTPDAHVNRVLSAEEYAAALRQIRDRLRVHNVSITGGEPTLNPHLPKFLKDAKSTFELVEITTNGSLLGDKMVSLLAATAPDLVKVSLDTINPHDYAEVVGLGKSNGMLSQVLSGIQKLCDGPFEVALNTVVMKRSLHGLKDLIDFAQTTGCAVHLLDYVYYPSKRKDWEMHFVPMEFLAEIFTERYGPAQKVMRYGCTFYRFDIGGIKVQFKDSMRATVRASACNRCQEFCQEGPYGLKMSINGWVTACPSIDEAKGVLISPELSNQEAGARLLSLSHMFTHSEVDTDSFERFLRARNLHPRISRDEVRRLFDRSTIS